jgi:phosphatidylglycerophosphatase A
MPQYPGDGWSQGGILLHLVIANAPVVLQLSLTSLVFCFGVGISGRAEGIIKLKDARVIGIDEIVGMGISLVTSFPSNRLLGGRVCSVPHI